MAEEKIKQELLECPICHDNYDENSKLPRVLPCRHTHCSECLSKLLSSDKLKCSICNATHEIKNGDITNIPKDNTLRQLMDILNRKEINKCTACDEDVVAVCYCEACEDYLCEKCSEAHRLVKLTKNHSLLNFKSLSKDRKKQRQNTCTEPDHENHELILYCETCHKPVCCRHNHSTHNVTDINEAIREKKEKIQNLTRDIGDVNIDLHVDRIRKMCIKLKEKCDRLKSIITKQFNQHSVAISTKCTALKNEADLKTNGKLEQLSNAADILENKKQALSIKLSEAKALLKCTDYVTFLRDYNGIMSELNEAKTLLRNSEDATTVHFVQACTADDFNKIINALGAVEENEHATVARDLSINVEGSENDVSIASSQHAGPGILGCTQELHSGQFMEILKSLLQDESTSGSRGVVEASGGEPEVDNQCDNPHIDKEIVMDNLKNLAGGFKAIKQYIPRGKLAVINTPTVTQMVRMRFQTLKLQGDWVIEDDQVTVRSATENEAETCMEVLVESVLEEDIHLPRGSELIVDTDKWQMVKVQVLHETKSVGIYATCTSALRDACDTVRIFLRDNLIKCVVLEYQEQVAKFIMHQKSRLSKIQESNSQFFVSVTLVDNNKIRIKGIGFGLCRSVRMIHSLAMRFKGDEEERFDSDDEEEEEDRFSDDESTSDVVDVGVNMNLELPDGAIFIKTLCLPGDDRVIFAVVGDITTLPVEVVINPANQSLKHDGGLSKILVQKGGALIQEECSNHVRRNGKVSVGDIYSSRAGNLPFSTIIHAVGPKWNDGTKQEKDILHGAVTKCLREASRKQLASIAIPAIGTGANKFPESEATLTIVSAVKDYLLENPRTSLNEIYLCHVSLEIVNEFSKSVHQCFNEKDIIISSAHTSTNSDATKALTREATMRHFMF